MNTNFNNIEWIQTNNIDQIQTLTILTEYTLKQYWPNTNFNNTDQIQTLTILTEYKL